MEPATDSRGRASDDADDASSAELELAAEPRGGLLDAAAPEERPPPNSMAFRMSLRVARTPGGGPD
jgi:hypothetical protein